MDVQVTSDFDLSDGLVVGYSNTSTAVGCDSSSALDSAESLVTSDSIFDDKSPVTSTENPEKQVTSDLSQVKPAKPAVTKNNVQSIDAYKSRKKTSIEQGRKRRVSADPDRPPTPPGHQWRQAEKAWVLWRVTYNYATGKQKKSFKFVNGSYVSVAAVQAARRRVNDQRRENRAGSIFD